MWEFRLVWQAAPSWWEIASSAAKEALERCGRSPESRPDTYLVLFDRPDVGLKLRGDEGELEIKVRHAVRDGWELWEKTPFYRWNDLEATRFAVLLQRERPSKVDPAARPLDGVTAMLDSLDIPWREVRIDKLRMQGRAAELSSIFSAGSIDPSCLAEIVTIDGAGPTARSICFETMTPEVNVRDAVPDAQAARNAGYPEFLIDALRR